MTTFPDFNHLADIFITQWSLSSDIAFRIFFSTLLGFVIGIERELTNKSAGLRTHILVCLGSTVFTILSIEGFSSVTLPDGSKIINDPARIAAQILTGIGFIGGGAVLHHGISIYGLTTAASLWITASIGMAVGVGSYTLGILTAVISFVILVLIRKIEIGYLSRHTRKSSRIKVTVICDQNCIKEVQEWFYKEFKTILEMNLKKSKTDEFTTKLTFILDIYDINPIAKAYKKLKELKKIESLSLQQVTNES